MNIITGYSDKDVINLVSRDDVGKYFTTITDFEWYFFIDITCLKAIISMVGDVAVFKSTYNIKKIMIDEPYARVYCSYTAAHDKGGVISFITKMGFNTYEADVSPYKRMLIDDDSVEIADNYRIAFIDIETDDRKEPGKEDKIVIGEKQILSFSGFENEDNKFTVCSDDEVEVLTSALKYMSGVDVIVGWNSKSFDLPYIKERLKLYKNKGIDIEKKAKFDWRHVVHIDLMWRFKNVYKYDQTLTSFSLKRVTAHFQVGAKTELDNRKIYDLFVNDRDLLIKYNMQDCRLLYQLEQKLGVIHQMITMSRFCRTSLSEFYITELLDNLILNFGRKNQIHLRTKEYVEANDDSYAGGFVLDPKPGMHKNVVIFDFTSLYPNIIRTWNISPETLTRTPKPGVKYFKGVKEGVFFNAEKPGLLPMVSAYLLEERQKLKAIKARLIAEGKQETSEYKNADRNESIVKEAANSLYGVSGNVRSRYYSIDLAESITLSGQHLIKFGQKFFDGLGYNVVSGDTDSIMVVLPEGADHLYAMEKFHEGLDAHLHADYGVEKVFTRFKYEKKFSKFIVVKKKNYVGRMIDEGGKPRDKVYAKGLEMIKKDTIKYTRAQLNELVRQLLYEDHEPTHYEKLIETAWSEMHSREFAKEEISISKKISKPFEEYKTLPVHVRLAKSMWDSDNKDFFIGMDMQYIIVNNLDKENKAIHASKYTGVFDREVYWEKHIYPPMKRILSVVFPQFDWDKYDMSKVDNPARGGKKRRKKVKKTNDTDNDESSDD
jgi:DNA polymerase elongation subunit (family B)